MFSGGPMIIFEIYIMSWLQGFYNEDTGPIYEEAQVKTLYQYQGIAGCASAFCLLAFVGKIIDTFSPKILLPLSFFIRGVLFLLTYLITDPNSYEYYFVVPMLYVSHYSTVIILLSYLNKMYPKEVRGMLNSVQGLFSKIGQLCFIQICLRLYEANYRLPFLGVACIDAGVSIVLTFSIIFT